MSLIMCNTRERLRFSTGHYRHHSSQTLPSLSVWVACVCLYGLVEFVRFIRPADEGGKNKETGSRTFGIFFFHNRHSHQVHLEGNVYVPQRNRHTHTHIYYMCVYKYEYEQSHLHDIIKEKRSREESGHPPHLRSRFFFDFYDTKREHHVRKKKYTWQSIYLCI